MIIFVAALQNIPGEIEDAAKLDGPGFFKRLFYIKLPLIWDTIKVAVILCISGSLKAFDLVIVMTGAARLMRPNSWQRICITIRSKYIGSVTVVQYRRPS